MSVISLASKSFLPTRFMTRVISRNRNREYVTAANANFAARLVTPDYRKTRPREESIVMRYKLK